MELKYDETKKVKAAEIIYTAIEQFSEVEDVEGVLYSVVQVWAMEHNENPAEMLARMCGAAMLNE